MAFIKPVEEESHCLITMSHHKGSSQYLATASRHNIQLITSQVSSQRFITTSHHNVSSQHLIPTSHHNVSSQLLMTSHHSVIKLSHHVSSRLITSCHNIWPKHLVTIFSSQQLITMSCHVITTSHCNVFSKHLITMPHYNVSSQTLIKMPHQNFWQHLISVIKMTCHSISSECLIIISHRVLACLITSQRNASSQCLITIPHPNVSSQCLIIVSHHNMSSSHHHSVLPQPFIVQLFGWLTHNVLLGFWRCD